jgi:hypothetical protein
LLGFVEPIRNHRLIVVALLDRDPAATVLRIITMVGRAAPVTVWATPLGTTNVAAKSMN